MRQVYMQPFLGSSQRLDEYNTGELKQMSIFIYEYVDNPDKTVNLDLQGIPSSQVWHAMEMMI